MEYIGLVPKHANFPAVNQSDYRTPGNFKPEVPGRSRNGMVVGSKINEFELSFSGNRIFLQKGIIFIQSHNSNFTEFEKNHKQCISGAASLFLTIFHKFLV